MELIPTGLKDKLPKLYCYPTGAQIVSEALVDVPQYDNLRIWFSYWPKSSTVIYVTYNVTVNEPRLLNRPRYLSPRWDVHVYAVPRELNAIVKTHLKAEGLVRVREWLATPRTETWLQESQRLTIRYDAGADALLCS